MTQKRVVFEYDKYFGWVFAVIRNTKKSKSNGLWISATIINPENQRNHKLLVLFNHCIVESLEHCGPIKPGNLFVFYKQIFAVRTKPNDDVIVYEAQFNGTHLPNDLIISYMTDPFDIFGNKNCTLLKEKQTFSVNGYHQDEMLKKYVEFNDHINYRHFYENQKKKARKKKRKLNLKRRKRQNKSFNNETNNNININLNKERTKQEIEELKRKHLFVPDHILENPYQLVRVSGNNIIRLIYDSDEDEIQQNENKKENKKNKNNATCTANVTDESEVNLYVKSLLDQVYKEERDNYKGSWLLSKCGMYWEKND